MRDRHTVRTALARLLLLTRRPREGLCATKPTVCLVPVASVIEDLKSGCLVRLLPSYRTTEPVIHALHPGSRHVPVKVRVFLEFLVRRLRRLSNSKHPCGLIA